MINHYYITLCDKHMGQYVDVYAPNKDEAYNKAKAKFGILNVSTVYTDKTWARKNTKRMEYLGELYSQEKIDYLRRKRLIN